MSPLIQNVAFKSTGLNAVYIPFVVEKTNLRNAISGLRFLGVKGFNVTAPHKINVVKFLDEVDRTVADIGSANTVKNNDGSLVGYNTDGPGALKALEEAGAHLNSTILLFGAGGASRAIAHTLGQHARKIILVNRTDSRARQLKLYLEQKFEIEVSHEPLSGGRIKELVREADVVINASSMGMNGNVELPIDEGWLRSNQWVLDIVYTPLETRLLKVASLAGAKTITGLDMLVNQGACSFEIWTSKPAPIRQMRLAIAQKLSARTDAESS